MVEIEQSSSIQATKVAIRSTHANIHSLVVKKGIEFIEKIAPFFALIIKNINNYGPFKQVEVAIADKEPISETLRWIAHGLTYYVSKYHGYVINGCHYNTKDRDKLWVTQNSRVNIVATTMQISSAKDKNPVFGELCFYGIITEIWDLD